MARPKSATHDIKRDQILDTAAQCFARQSFPVATMNDIAAACGTSKARLYHYYQSKDAILFDVLDRYTQKLLAIIGQVQATAQRRNLDDRAALHELIRAFLHEYQTSAERHVSLLHDTKFLSAEVDARLGESPRELILNRQRDVVAAVQNQTAVTMMLFGMINWTFTWLRPGGRMSYDDFAEDVIGFLDRGLGDLDSRTEI